MPHWARDPAESRTFARSDASAVDRITIGRVASGGAERADSGSPTTSCVVLLARTC
jgi:hypothetical protein